MAFATLSVDFVASLARFEEDMNRASKSVAGLENRFATMGRTVSGALAGLGVGIGVSGLAAFAKSGIDAADSLNDMSQRLGVSVKDLASFKLAAEQSGTSLDGVGAGIARLSRSIGEAEGGNKQLGKALTDLGITARDPKEAFFQLADAVQKTDDPNKRAALLSQVLGKSYGELVPLLSQGGEALRQSARDSESFADAMSRLAPEADKFNDSLAQLKSNLAGIAAQAIGPAVKSFNEYIAVMQEVNKTGSLLDKIRFYGLGNASDEIVNKVRKAAEASAATAKAARDAAAKAAGGMIKPLAETKVRTAKASDPLASILGQTDTARAAEYANLIGLLEKRFDSGRIKAGQFAEAVAIINNKFNKTQIDALGTGSYFTTDPKVVEFIKQQTEAVNELNLAMAEDGKSAADAYASALAGLVSDTDIEKTRRLQESISILDKALFDGAIGAEQHAQALAKLTSGTGEKLKDMDEFAKSAAHNIQTSFADFLFDPFDKGMQGMLQSFGKTLQRMIADAVAADLAKKLFGDLAGGTAGDSGWAGSALKSIGSLFGFADGGVAAYGKPVALPRFAGGGVSSSMAIFGEAGPEAAVPLPDGRRIPVDLRGSGGHTIIVNVNGSHNAPDVRRAAGQGAREALGMLNGAHRYA